MCGRFGARRNDLQAPLGAEQLRHQVPHTQPLHVPVPTVLENDQRNTQGEAMKKVSERNIRLTIAMMRSMANCKPISPFHIEASKEMEAMLEELLALRKQLKEKK
jgi:hypothetical protein